MENTILYKAIIEDKAQGAIKKLQFGHNTKTGRWRFRTKLLFKSTLETVTIESGPISHQSMCLLVRMFFDINGYEIDTDKYEGE